MKPARRRLVGVGAALSAVAVVAPVSSASAATAAPAVAADPIAAGAWWDSAFGLAFSGPFAGEGVTVTGPMVITTAPTSFINSNTQISVGVSWNGGQLVAG